MIYSSLDKQTAHKYLEYIKFLVIYCYFDWVTTKPLGISFKQNKLNKKVACQREYINALKLTRQRCTNNRSMFVQIQQSLVLVRHKSPENSLFLTQKLWVSDWVMVWQSFPVKIQCERALLVHTKTRLTPKLATKPHILYMRRLVPPHRLQKELKL